MAAALTAVAAIVAAAGLQVTVAADILLRAATVAGRPMAVDHPTVADRTAEAVADMGGKK